MKKTERLFNFPKVLIIFLFSLTVLIFNAEGIYNWCTQLEFSTFKSNLINIIEKYHNFSQKTGLNLPYQKLRSRFEKLRNLRFSHEEEAREIARKFQNLAWETKEQVLKDWESTYHAKRPLRVFFMGDSLANSTRLALVPQTNRLDCLNLYARGRVSTNLSNLYYGNWIEESAQILKNRSFDLVIIMMGANASDAAREKGKLYKWKSPGWYKIYSERFKTLINQFKSEKVKKIFWVAIPPMRQEAYGARMREQNQIIQKLCQQEGVRFIEIKQIMGDENGFYTASKMIDGKEVRLRTKDSIHYTREGASLISQEIFRVIKQEFKIIGL